MTYNAEDFLLDDAFASWVQHKKNDRQWQQWLSGHPEQLSVVEEALTIAQSFQFATESVDSDKLLTRINSTLDTRVIDMSSPHKSRHSKRFIWMTSIAVAASLAALIIVRPWATTGVYVAPIIAATIDLPAASVVDMSADATLNYYDQSWSKERRMELDGAATFDVTKGVPFIVETSNGIIEVLGTKFSIHSEENRLSVVVDHGRVRVTSDSNEEILTKEMMYFKNPDEGMRQLLTKAKKMGAFIQFDNEPIVEIIKSIEASYNVVIEMESGVDNEKCTSYIRKNFSLDKALQSVTWTTRMGYTIDGDQVTIYSKR